MAVIELIRNRAPRWSALTWIIIACAAVFVIVRIAAATGASAAGGSMAQTLVDRLALSSDAAALMSRPWTPLTYMFTHYEVMHLIFNMLWLYWFGTLLLTVFSGTRLMAVYLTGGLAGAATYLLFGLTASLTAPHSMVGASAAVLAVVAATAVALPRLRINLMLIGPVEVRWIALAIVALDAAAIGGTSIGAHIAHLAGAAAGVLFMIMIRRTATSRPGTVRHRPENTSGRVGTDDRKQLDMLLDKIRISGYASLTAEERRTLFEISRK